MAIKRLVPSPVYSVYCRHRQSDCRGVINNEAGSRRTMLECCCRKLNSQKYQRTVGYPSTSWASCRVRADVRDIRQTDIRTDDGRRSPLNAPAPPTGRRHNKPIRYVWHCVLRLPRLQSTAVQLYHPRRLCLGCLR